MNLNKLTISNLILLIINKDNTSLLRDEALKELKKRAYTYGLDYNDLINIDEENIAKRGFKTSEYLFSKNTDMQKLMESYFENIYVNNSKLLLCETILCNEFGSFFDKVSLKEISNIKKRLKDKNLTLGEVQRLMKIIDVLKERYSKRPTSFFSSDDTYIILNELKYEFDCNELIKDKLMSNVELMRRTLLGSSIDKEYIRYFHIYNIIKQEYKRLREPKKNITSQLKNGYKVDYNSEPIEKALELKRVKK